MLLVILIMLGLWLLQTVFLSAFYEGMKIAEIHNIGSDLMASYDKGLDSFIETADRAAYRNSIRIHLLSDSGKTTYYSDDHSFLSREKGHTPPDFLTLKKEMGARIGTSFDRMTQTKDGRKNLVYFACLEGPNYLYISTPIVPMDSTVNILRVQLLYTSLIALIISVLVSYFLARRITKPIESLVLDAAAFAKGDYSVRFKQYHYQEINSLSDTLNRASEDLASLEKERNNLVANVSHDLRTPLTIIKSHAELVRDISWNQTEKREKHLAIIIEESEKLTDMINEILDISKLRTEIEFKSVNLSQLIASVVGRFPKEDLTIEANIEEDLFVKGNSLRLEQAIYNFLANAIQHGNGCVSLNLFSIITRGEKQSLRCEIFNPGTPLNHSLKEKIWDRYYRSDYVGSDAHHQREVGGLGLSIAREILDIHGASYGVDSTEGGNIFWFELGIQTFS